MLHSLADDHLRKDKPLYKTLLRHMASQPSPWVDLVSDLSHSVAHQGCAHLHHPRHCTKKSVVTFLTLTQGEARCCPNLSSCWLLNTNMFLLSGYPFLLLYFQRSIYIMTRKRAKTFNDIPGCSRALHPTQSKKLCNCLMNSNFVYMVWELGFL